MPENSGPEPTGWELLRGLQELKQEVGKIGEKVVPLDVYNADKQGTAERFVRVEARVSGIETNSVEAEKLKRQQRLTISLAIASPFLALLVGFIGRSWGIV